MICMNWHLDAGKADLGYTGDQNDLRVSGALLPLEICLQIQDQPVMRDRSPQQHQSLHSVGSAEELLILGCCID